MALIQLKAEKRETGTRGEVNRLRKQGLLPAVLYGQGLKDVLIMVREQELERVMSSGGGSICELHVSGDDVKHMVILKEVQRAVVGRKIIHADFQKINVNEAIAAEVPVQLVGTAAGEKTGGVVQHSLWTVMVQGLPAALPPRIEIDISALELHDKLCAGDLSLPEGVELVSNPDQVIVSIIAPRAVAEQETAEDEAVEGEAGADKAEPGEA
ncbi:MAG: 50S ribosomal protein L25 [Heliobacteriaceae bacterium]|nr:50S ribosomal protein L25 [Heliobacteriaceae bacterium]